MRKLCPRHARRHGRALLAAALLAGLLLIARGTARAVEYTLFEGTQYPLTVHVLHGEAPGPTVMVQGGIQGDETAGFLTAQLLTRSRVRKGTLVIIPRANVPSIERRARQVNVDLNRRFDRDYNQYYEDHLARAIRFLLAGSDAFIHLHEGSGFHSPVWVDAMRNPRRFGQSVIIDTPNYAGVLDLAGLVSPVIEELNKSVREQDRHFTLFSTDTFDQASSNAEQRKSLTCYALENLTIPALAIEVSKDIADLPWKVRHQLHASVLFLARFGVEVEPPPFDARDLERYPSAAPLLRIGGKLVEPGRTKGLTLPAGKPITAEVARASGGPYAPVGSALASDRPGQNLLAAPRMGLGPFDAIDILADGRRVGSVRVRWTGDWRARPEAEGSFVVWVNKALHVIPPGGVITAIEGDQLLLDGVYEGTGSRRKSEILNFKGYVSDPTGNDGQDAGREIILDPKMFIARYVEDGAAPGERVCRIARETPGARGDEIAVRILPRNVERLRLVGPDGRPAEIVLGGPAASDLPPGRYTLAGVDSNGEQNKIQAFFGRIPAPWGSTFELAPGERLRLDLRLSTTLAPLAETFLAAAPPKTRSILAQAAPRP